MYVNIEAEDYHQQYLSRSKNPNGYGNHGPNGPTRPFALTLIYGSVGMRFELRLDT